MPQRSESTGQAPKQDKSLLSCILTPSIIAVVLFFAANIAWRIAVEQKQPQLCHLYFAQNLRGGRLESIVGLWDFTIPAIASGVIAGLCSKKATHFESCLNVVVAYVCTVLLSLLSPWIVTLHPYRNEHPSVMKWIFIVIFHFFIFAPFAIMICYKAARQMLKFEHHDPFRSN